MENHFGTTWISNVLDVQWNPPFSCSSLPIKFCDPKSITSVFNFFYIRYSSVSCSNPLPPKQISNADLIVYEDMKPNRGKSVIHNFIFHIG
jgi:hypothetical protein